MAEVVAEAAVAEEVAEAVAVAAVEVEEVEEVAVAVVEAVAAGRRSRLPRDVGLVSQRVGLLDIHREDSFAQIRMRNALALCSRTVSKRPLRLTHELGPDARTARRRSPAPHPPRRSRGSRGLQRAGPHRRSRHPAPRSAGRTRRSTRPPRFPLHPPPPLARTRTAAATARSPPAASTTNSLAEQKLRLVPGFLPASRSQTRRLLRSPPSRACTRAQCSALTGSRAEATSHRLGELRPGCEKGCRRARRATRGRRHCPPHPPRCSRHGSPPPGWRCSAGSPRFQSRRAGPPTGRIPRRAGSRSRSRPRCRPRPGRRPDRSRLPPRAKSAAPSPRCPLRDGTTHR